MLLTEPVEDGLYWCCNRSTFHNVQEMFFSETCVNLAKFIVEDDQVKEKKERKELHMEIPESV